MTYTVGFTGSRLGMTHRQIAEVIERLKKYEPDYVRHGDCLGADAQFHDLCLAYSKHCKIIIHPPINTTMRAFCKGAYAITEPKSYLKRNKDIVTGSHILIACPAEKTESLNGGTWTTVRYARAGSTAVTIIFP